MVLVSSAPTGLYPVGAPQRSFQFPTTPLLKLFQPHNMPKPPDKAESRMLEAFAAAKREKKRDISKIARDFNVPRRTLHNRVKNGRQARTARKPVNKVLEGHQEEALVR